MDGCPTHEIGTIGNDLREFYEMALRMQRSTARRSDGAVDPETLSDQFKHEDAAIYDRMVRLTRDVKILERSKSVSAVYTQVQEQERELQRVQKILRVHELAGSALGEHDRAKIAMMQERVREIEKWFADSEPERAQFPQQGWQRAKVWLQREIEELDKVLAVKNRFEDGSLNFQTLFDSTAKRYVVGEDEFDAISEEIASFVDMYENIRAESAGDLVAGLLGEEVADQTQFLKQMYETDVRACAFFYPLILAASATEQGLRELIQASVAQIETARQEQEEFGCEAPFVHVLVAWAYRNHLWAAEDSDDVRFAAEMEDGRLTVEQKDITVEMNLFYDHVLAMFPRKEFQEKQEDHVQGAKGRSYFFYQMHSFHFFRANRFERVKACPRIGQALAQHQCFHPPRQEIETELNNASDDDGSSEVGEKAEEGIKSKMFYLEKEFRARLHDYQQALSTFEDIISAAPPVKVISLTKKSPAGIPRTAARFRNYMRNNYQSFNIAKLWLYTSEDDRQPFFMTDADIEGQYALVTRAKRIEIHLTTFDSSRKVAQDFHETLQCIATYAAFAVDDLFFDASVDLSSAIPTGENPSVPTRVSEDDLHKRCAANGLLAEYFAFVDMDAMRSKCYQVVNKRLWSWEDTLGELAHFANPTSLCGSGIQILRRYREASMGYHDRVSAFVVRPRTSLVHWSFSMAVTEVDEQLCRAIFDDILKADDAHQRFEVQMKIQLIERVRYWNYPTGHPTSHDKHLLANVVAAMMTHPSQSDKSFPDFFVQWVTSPQDGYRTIVRTVEGQRGVFYVVPTRRERQRALMNVQLMFPEVHIPELPKRIPKINAKAHQHEPFVPVDRLGHGGGGGGVVKPMARRPIAKRPVARSATPIDMGHRESPVSVGLPLIDILVYRDYTRKMEESFGNDRSLSNIEKTIYRNLAEDLLRLVHLKIPDGFDASSKEWAMQKVAAAYLYCTRAADGFQFASDAKLDIYKYRSDIAPFMKIQAGVRTQANAWIPIYLSLMSDSDEPAAVDKMLKAYFKWFSTFFSPGLRTTPLGPRPLRH